MASTSNERLLTRLVAILWDYRAVYDRLHFLLRAQAFLIEAGHDEGLHHLVGLIDDSTAAIARLDLEREVLLVPLADGGTPSLRDVRAGVDEPWRSILADHQRAIQDAVDTTVELVLRNGQILRRADEQATASGRP